MVEKLLGDLGYSDKEILKLIESYSLGYLTEAKLYENVMANFKFFLENGYTSKQIKRMTLLYPALYGYTINNIESKRNFLLDMGYTFEQINKMTVSLPAIYGYKKENMENKLNYFLNLGYTFEQIIKMTINLPQLYSYGEDNIEDKRECLLSFGYTLDQINDMTACFVQLYSLSKHTIESKRRVLLELGIDQFEINKMTVLLPQLYGYKNENIEEKVWFLSVYQNANYFVQNPMYLIQSVGLTYARSCFLVSQGYELNENNFKWLFVNSNYFYKKFQVTNEKVKELYPYSEYKENMILGGYVAPDDDFKVKKYVKRTEK